MIFLISIMSFANFVFYPLVIATIIAFIIEQIFRSQDKAPEILRSMAVRKYFWRQASDSYTHLTLPTSDLV